MTGDCCKTGLAFKSGAFKHHFFTTLIHLLESMIMSKAQDSKKESKKPAAKTAKEKQEAKKAKKAEHARKEL